MMFFDGRSDYSRPKLDERIYNNGSKIYMMSQNCNSIVVAYQFEHMFDIYLSIY